MKNNTIAIFSFVKNEVDFIEKFVSHNLGLADEMTVVDNGSTDGTLEKLKEFGKSIRLIEDKSHFSRKGPICTRLMRESSADLLIPLDADELVVFDDRRCVSPETNSTRDYLKRIELKINQRFQVRNTYMKHPEESGWWGMQKSNKRFVSRKGFLSIDSGFHCGKMIKDENPIPCDISYLHYHFRSKDSWEKSTEQKLKARLGGKWEDLNFLMTYKGPSFHTGRELIRYRTTGIWHTVGKQFKHDNLLNY